MKIWVCYTIEDNLTPGDSLLPPGWSWYQDTPFMVHDETGTFVCGTCGHRLHRKRQMTSHTRICAEALSA